MQEGRRRILFILGCHDLDRRIMLLAGVSRLSHSRFCILLLCFLQEPTGVRCDFHVFVGCSFLATFQHPAGPVCFISHMMEFFLSDHLLHTNFGGLPYPLVRARFFDSIASRAPP
ncbi:hypothetical protein BDW71DRAFT_26495 [Aspergillus fruticulosus]